MSEPKKKINTGYIPGKTLTDEWKAWAQSHIDADTAIEKTGPFTGARADAVKAKAKIRKQPTRYKE